MSGDEWAERIKATVQVEFDRVAKLFSAAAEGQSEAARAASPAILSILEEKRIEVMGRQDAGYFIRVWQEITDQVRNHTRLFVGHVSRCFCRDLHHVALVDGNQIQNSRKLYSQIHIARKFIKGDPEQALGRISQSCLDGLG